MKPIPRPLTEPWAISETGMQLVLAVWSRGEMFASVREQALAARDGKPLENSRSMTERQGVAIIPIEDVLFRKGDLLTNISGGTSYETLRKDVQKALDNPRVNAILLNIDSPGGEASGCHELAQFILESRGVKPIWAYVGGMGASGAYWLACAAEHVVCAETAFLGSIGVRQTVVDDSKRNQAEGLREVEIISSQSPNKRSIPVDDALIEKYQERVDELAQIFVEFVAKARGTTPENVIESFGGGGVLIGARAEAAGMADAVGNFEGTLAELAGGAFQTSGSPALAAVAREKPMKLKTEVAPTASMGSAKCDECGDDMGENAKTYCAKCMDDGDGDEDEECKALGLALKSSRADRLARISGLVQLEQKVLGATESTNAAEAVGRVALGAEAVRENAVLKAEIAAAVSGGIQRDLRAVLSAGLDKKCLSLGAIQKSLPLVLRGEQKAAWVAAMGKLESVTRESVIDAACGVSISKDDLEAVGEFVKSSAPIAAATFDEPKRNTEEESEELDATSMEIGRLAAKARAAYDRGNALQTK